MNIRVKETLIIKGIICSVFSVATYQNLQFLYIFIYTIHTHCVKQATIAPFSCEDHHYHFFQLKACTRMTNGLCVVNSALQCSVSFARVHARPRILKTLIRSLRGVLTVPAPLEPNRSPGKKLASKRGPRFGLARGHITLHCVCVCERLS